MNRGRPWRAFGILVLIEFLAVMDASIVNIALPSIGDALEFSTAELPWIVDGYLIGLAGFMLLAGRAADIVGRRTMFLIGVAAFTVFSLLCAAALEPWQLVASRVGQGLGAALAIPAAIALITDLFPEGAERNKALAVFGGMGGVAAPVGLVLGGALTEVSWQWIFLINIPIGILVVAAGLRYLPKGRRSTGRRMDVLSALGLTVGMILLTAAVLRGGEQGWASPTTISQFGGAAAAMALFGIRQFTARDPLVPRGLFRSRAIVIGNTTFALVGTILLGTFFITTLYLQQVRGLAPLEAALMYLPMPAAMLAGTQLAPRILRFGARNALMGSLVLQSGALLAWALLMRPDENLIFTFILPAATWALGAGIAIVGSFVVCTSGTESELAGAASGLATTSYQGGGAIGLALLVLLADAWTATSGGGTDALTAGFTLALIASAALAVLGAIASRFLPSGPRPKSNSDDEHAMAEEAEPRNGA